MRLSRTFIVLPAVFALLTATGPAFAAGVEAGPVGIFCGALASNGEMVTAETEFTPGKSGFLAGAYRYADGDRDDSGTLREADDRDGNPLTRLFTWQDAYGSGVLIVDFMPDYNGFEGRWGLSADSANNRWSGRRCADGI